MERTVGSKSEGFQLVIRSDGSYLTVEIGSLKEKMKEAGVTDFDALQLARLVRAADGVETKLDPAPGDGEENTVIPVSVEIPPDAMTAAVRFDEKNGNLPPSVSDVIDALTAKKVVYGIDRAAVERGLTDLSPFIAARGTAPEAGEDALPAPRTA